jgi:hypothetical protein
MGDTAVTARARSPRASTAKLNRSVLSTPPEKATARDGSDSSWANSLDLMDCVEPPIPLARQQASNPIDQQHPEGVGQILLVPI